MCDLNELWSDKENKCTIIERKKKTSCCRTKGHLIFKNYSWDAVWSIVKEFIKENGFVATFFLNIFKIYDMFFK